MPFVFHTWTRFSQENSWADLFKAIPNFNQITANDLLSIGDPNESH